MTQEWSPSSWRGKNTKHRVEYGDDAGVERACDVLSKLPGLVAPQEVLALQGALAEAAAGRAFVLHGGDCVERFIDCNEETISNKLKIMLQMSTVLTYAARKPVVRIGRIAGQYFKPRSSNTEIVNGEEVLTYRGDTVHQFAAGPQGRTPDPNRLVQGYFHAAATLNFLRAGTNAGFADLHHPYSWNLHSIESLPDWPRYKEILDRIIDAVSFMESFGGLREDIVGKVDFYTSHEGLHLPYEESLTRRLPDGRYLNVGAHLLWIGDRTRSLDDAHVEYFRGIANPIAVKIGPGAKPGGIVALAERLDPERAPGRLTFITRLGANRVEELLRPLVAAVKETGRQVLWSCDPMHGNTATIENGTKTRHFDNILQEITKTFGVMGDAGPAGVHFELTGEEVTECLGGGSRLGPADLSRDYRSYCDPRLNYAQSMEMAFLIAGLLAGR